MLYRIGASIDAPIDRPSNYNAYVCTLPDGSDGILKVAKTADKNHLLDREADLLNTMKEEAKILEPMFQKEHPGEGVLNNHFFFPRLVESFIFEEQGGRRVNILSFSDICKRASDLEPLAHLASKLHVRIDPKTSAWILGKLLKLLVFTHGLSIYIGDGSGENILLNRDEHFVAIFDWSGAIIEHGKIPAPGTRNEIIQLTESVVLALGGNPDTGEIPDDLQLEDSRYRDLLKELATGVYSDAKEAHDDFYDLIRTIWPTRGFHPFTTHPL
jgi:hypothetical protein